MTLPAWAIVTPERRAHIERVASLLSAWAMTLGSPGTEQTRRIRWVIDSRWPLLRETVDFWNALVAH